MAKLLVVDDDRDMLNLVRMALQKDGHQVDIEADATDVQPDRCRQYDLILLDVMMACMFICCIIWYAALSFFESREIVYPGYVSNQQVQQMISENPDSFVMPEEDFLARYALFDKDRNLKVSNIEGQKRSKLLEKAEENSVNTLKHSYADGSYVIFLWHFRKEFANPVLRASLPPFEYLWWATLGIACGICWLLNALWLRKKLVAKLKLFRDVSEKVGTQELNFEIPHAGIKEFDQALGAMEDMRQVLCCSLSSQWAAQQQRDSEMAALAHDLKTPLTLISGNAELLLEDDLQENHRKMVETILDSNNRAKQYVVSLMETSRGENEAFESCCLNQFLDELCRLAEPMAQAEKIKLHLVNELSGCVSMQKHHLLRAIGNVVQNAIEYTPKGGNVTVEGTMTEDGWQVTVGDEGPGFSKSAILHATERLWRGDSARAANRHNGLGLWFAAQVIHNHSGQIVLSNGDKGGMVEMNFKQTIQG